MKGHELYQLLDQSVFSARQVQARETKQQQRERLYHSLTRG